MASLKELVKDPSTIIVDVRSPMEFALEHIHNAIHISVEHIPYIRSPIKLLNSKVSKIP